MNDFLDIVRASAEGSVTIDIDHPSGVLQWHLPGQRADELVEAIRERQGRVTFDRPPQEDYVRASVVRGPFSFEVGIEYRDGVEAWKEGVRGFAQIFQPYGLPRNR